MKRILPILLVLLLLPFFGVRADDGGKLLQQGETGEEVVRVQVRLFDLGYYTYKPTGSFRTVTRASVVSYQVASGLMSDGSVGQETFRSLFSGSARRIEFRAAIPLTFTAQGAILEKGKPLPWKSVRTMLTEGTSYRIKNPATREELSLVFETGENHAEMKLPVQYGAHATAVAQLTKWLGNTNSFYKCTVLVELDEQWVSASMQWNGDDRVCLFFQNSLSHVLDLPDAEHAANIKKGSE